MTQEESAMLNQEVLDEDQADPFSSRELLLALGSAMVWVTLSAVIVWVLPAVLS